MSAHSQRVIWVEILENTKYPRFPLLRVASGKHDPKTPSLPAGNEYPFFEMEAPEKEGVSAKKWLVLRDNPEFGMPCTTLRGFENAKRIVVAHDNGDAFFED